jgi:hypothetical protein
VLNGVSAATGRPIVTTALALDYRPKGRCPVAAAMAAEADIKAKAARVMQAKSAVSGPPGGPDRKSLPALASKSGCASAP